MCSLSLLSLSLLRSCSSLTSVCAICRLDSVAHSAVSEPFQLSELLAAKASDDDDAAGLHMGGGASSALGGNSGGSGGGGAGDENDAVLFQKAELRGHTGAVYTAKFSPCGRMLASGALDCKVLLWDVTTKFTHQQLASLAQHSQLVIDVSWAHDSSRLLSASYDHTVKLWDVEKSALVHSAEVAGLVQCVSFNGAGEREEEQELSLWRGS